MRGGPAQAQGVDGGIRGEGELEFEGGARGARTRVQAKAAAVGSAGNEVRLYPALVHCEWRPLAFGFEAQSGHAVLTGQIWTQRATRAARAARARVIRVMEARRTSEAIP